MQNTSEGSFRSHFTHSQFPSRDLLLPAIGECIRPCLDHPKDLLSTCPSCALCLNAAGQPGTPRCAQDRFPAHEKPAQTSLLHSNHLLLPSSPYGRCDRYRHGSSEAQNTIGMETCRRLPCLPSHTGTDTACRIPAWRHPNPAGHTSFGLLCIHKVPTPFSPHRF